MYRVYAAAAATRAREQRCPLPFFIPTGERVVVNTRCVCFSLPFFRFLARSAAFLYLAPPSFDASTAFFFPLFFLCPSAPPRHRLVHVPGRRRRRFPFRPLRFRRSRSCSFLFPPPPPFKPAIEPPTDRAGDAYRPERNRGRERARRNICWRGGWDTRVFSVHAKRSHSRNARETQHGRLARDESEFLADVHTKKAARCLSPSRPPCPFRSALLSAFSRPVYSNTVHAHAHALPRSLSIYLLASLSSSLPHIYAYRCIAICLRFCTMLLLSLRRFLAFCSSALFPLAARSYVRLLCFFPAVFVFRARVHRYSLSFSRPSFVPSLSLSLFHSSPLLHLSFVLVPLIAPFIRK